MKEFKEIQPIEHELSSKVEYAYEGNMQVAQTLRLNPPTTRNLKECSELKQSFYRAVSASTEGSGTTTDTSEINEIELDGSQIMMLIAGSPHVELSQVMTTAISLFCAPGIALLDGEQKLTKPLIDLITPDELEDLVGKYLVNFILASALERMRKAFLKKS